MVRMATVEFFGKQSSFILGKYSTHSQFELFRLSRLERSGNKSEVVNFYQLKRVKIHLDLYTMKLESENYRPSRVRPSVSHRYILNVLYIRCIHKFIRLFFLSISSDTQGDYCHTKSPTLTTIIALITYQ